MTREKKAPRVKPPKVVWVIAMADGFPWGIRATETLAARDATWPGETIHRYRLDEPKAKKGAKR